MNEIVAETMIAVTGGIMLWVLAVVSIMFKEVRIKNERS